MLQADKEARISMKVRRNPDEVDSQEAMERYLALFNRSLDAVYLHDFQGHFIDANDTALDLLGFSRADIAHLSFTDLLPEDQVQAATANLKELTDTGAQQDNKEYRLKRRDGSFVDVEIKAAVIYREGKPSHVLGIAHDITQRKRLDNALRTSERLYRLLADNMSDAVWLIDMDLRTVYASPSTEKLRGYSIAELQQLPPEKLVTPASLEYATAILAEEMVKVNKDPTYIFNRTLEMESYRKDGSTFWVENTFTLIRDDTGKPTHILGTGRDISQRKNAESDLQRSYEKLQKAMEGAVETISMISEVRDPYTAGHQKQVAQISAAIAKEMGLSDRKISAIKIAGTLHDIGKINIPSEILSKPGRLNRVEMDLIKSHPTVGQEILKSIDFPWPVCRIVSQHHERIDGSGYPSGLKGDETTVEARILAVADTVSAMASHRPYRPALGLDKALEEITSHRGTLYDPAVVDACCRLFREKGFKLDE
jgi:PAS domain S-box-containing protein/putative nucleotidyltransferase with HDIG domain